MNFYGILRRFYIEFLGSIVDNEVFSEVWVYDYL